MRILVTAGSSGAAWYLSKEIKAHFADKITLIIGDVYPRYLSASATIGDEYIRLPYIASLNYYEEMLQILKKNDIDVFVPIIDDDLFLFPCDNKDLTKLGIVSLAPPKKTVDCLTNKRKMEYFLRSIDVPTPVILNSLSDVNKKEEYIIKPEKGHGSIGIKKVKGSEIQANFDFKHYIVQELCDDRFAEISADTFLYKGVCKAYIRKRVAVKSGVCVKMEPYTDPDRNSILQSISKINQNVELPLASCIQFMKDDKGVWNVIDCNLRLGAGTALSDAAGFHIARAMLNALLYKKIDLKDLNKVNNVRAVLREYTEIVVK